QSVQDALPDASTTLFLALVELYKSGGIYVDLTTFFVRPLPPGLDGFVAGGEGGGGGGGEEVEGREGDCSMPTASNRRQRSLVMQYTSPRHPVVACALTAYDLETSPLNECLLLSKGEGYGGLDCVLKTLETCTQKAGMRNYLRDAAAVEWHGCRHEVAAGYSLKPESGEGGGRSGAETLDILAAIPPAPVPATPAPPPPPPSGRATAAASV
ncbi:unnamed protein product, partial [Laminaria digitata]